MRIRRLLVFAAVCAMAVASLLVGAGGKSVAEAQLRLKWGYQVDETHPGHLAAKKFAAAVEERTRGQIKFDLYPSMALGSPPEMAEQVRMGVTDMGLPTTGQLDKWVKAFGAVMLPFAYDDYDHAHRVMDGPTFQWFSEMAEKEGFILLSSWEWGFQNITNNRRPINTPGDVKGLKLRVAPELQMQAAFEALGAITATIAFPEVYMALAQRVVDGQGNPIQVIYFMKFYEVQKHLALTRHLYNSMIHVISAKTWAKLSPEQRTIFREESQKAAAFMRQAVVSQEADLIGKMEAAGLQVTRPDPAPFREAMTSAYEKIAKAYGEENVKKFREFIEGARTK